MAGGAVEEHGPRWGRSAVVTALVGSTAALISSQAWLDGRAQRLAVISAFFLVALAVQLVAVRQLSSGSVAIAPDGLLVGCLAAVAATAVWLLPQLSAPGLPVSGTGSLLLVEVAAVVAAGYVGVRARGLRPAYLAGLWTGALGSWFVFVGSLVSFALVPSSVPNTQGRAMLPTATAAQRLAENRIEAPDGYLGLLAVSLLLALIVIVVVPMGRRVTLPPLQRDQLRPS